MRWREFLSESFRAHKKEEYAEIFKRGTTDTDGVNTVYPWFYLRVFAVLAVVFALYALINSAMPGAADWETLYFVGGAFMDAALLVLLYELYPYKDFSILSLTVVCIVGGSFADFISAFIYIFHSFGTLSDGWKLAVIAGVSEEIAKGVPAIICILLLKKNRPSACFLIGAAVGTWFSITENASYIHTFPASRAILTATVRAFGCAFSHAAWTAIICYAFKKFRRPLLNIKFYAAVIFCMALHFCIDMPLSYAILIPEAAVCGLAAFTTCVFIIYSERKRAFGQETAMQKKPPLSFLHKFNLTLSALGFVTCALMIALSTVFSTTVYNETVFESTEEFLEFAHDGFNINPNPEREYDETLTNSYAEYEYGVLRFAEQRVADERITYIYGYSFGEENREPILPSRVFIAITEDKTDCGTDSDEDCGGEMIYYPYVFIYDDESLTYYQINSELENGRVVYRGGEKVYFYKQSDVPDTATIALTCVTVVSAAGWGAAYLILKRKKKDKEKA